MTCLAATVLNHTSYVIHLYSRNYLDTRVCITRVVGQCFGCSVYTWGDQVPDKALDILVTTIMQKAVGQEGSADCFHIGLLQGTLKATMSQDVTPPTPTKDQKYHSVSKLTLPTSIYHSNIEQYRKYLNKTSQEKHTVLWINGLVNLV